VCSAEEVLDERTAGLPPIQRLKQFSHENRDLEDKEITRLTKIAETIEIKNRGSVIS
jgi:hypothetical protein